METMGGIHHKQATASNAQPKLPGLHSLAQSENAREMRSSDPAANFSLYNRPSARLIARPRPSHSGSRHTI